MWGCLPKANILPNRWPLAEVPQGSRVSSKAHFCKDEALDLTLIIIIPVNSSPLLKLDSFTDMWRVPQ